MINIQEKLIKRYKSLNHENINFYIFVIRNNEKGLQKLISFQVYLVHFLHDLKKKCCFLFFVLFLFFLKNV